MKIEKDEVIQIMEIADSFKERLGLGQTACDYFAAIMFIVSSAIEKFEQLGEVCTATELDNLKKTLIGMVIGDLYNCEVGKDMAIMIADMVNVLEALESTKDNEEEDNERNEE